MAYTQLTMSPATIEFARAHGATGLHIGLLGALPTGTLFMQFLAAVVVNHLRYRRRLWFWLSIAQRLVYVPVALGAVFWSGASAGVWLWGLIAVTAVNHAMLHFCSPLWLSWMGDYLPHRGLSQFWGRRHVWMQWSAAVSLFGGALLLYKSGLEFVPAFAVLTGVAAVLGVVDILFFLKIEEPPVSAVPQPKLGRVLTAPFKDPQFRSYIEYTCFWHFAAMVGAPFISLYLLEHVGMHVYNVLLLWAASWVGGALMSGRLGHWVEKFGHRPMLILCTAFKALNMLALLCTPGDPTLAFWFLMPVLMADAQLNAGIAIANNGFLLKNSPSENRSMFIAAGTAVAGTVGGITAIVAGLLLTLIGSWSLSWGSFTIVGFHVLFAASLVLRLFALVLARRVQEPASHGTRHVVMELVGATPLRILRFPLGLYRNADLLADEELPRAEVRRAS